MFTTSTGMVADFAIQLDAPGSTLVVPDLFPGQPAKGVALLFADGDDSGGGGGGGGGDDDDDEAGPVASPMEHQRRVELVFASGWLPVQLSVATWASLPDDNARLQFLQREVATTVQAAADRDVTDF